MGVVRTLPGCELEFTQETMEMIAGAASYVLPQPFDLFITHGTDGEHSGHADPHPFGKALDFRIHNLPAPEMTRAALATIYGPSYTVIIEDAGTPNAHIHGQFRHDLWPMTVPTALLAAAREADANRTEAT